MCSVYLNLTGTDRHNYRSWQETRSWKTDISQDPRNIIVNSAGGHVGLLVRKISDVVSADMTKRESSPANMRGIQGEYFNGVYKTENNLIGILNVDKVLSIDD